MYDLPSVDELFSFLKDILFLLSNCEEERSRKLSKQL